MSHLEPTCNGAILRIAIALDFAARKHAAQRRKGVAQEPYVNHLAEVARLVAEATGGSDPDLVIAALLHDCIEDQGVLEEDLAACFGADVARLVAEVTDDKTLAKEERKRLQVAHAPQLGARARLLKVADKTANLRALTASPPADWSARRRRDYFGWAREVVEACGEIEPGLRAAFDQAWARGVY